MTDFTLPAHVCKLWLVRVTDTAGQVLPPGGFDFYGCAMAPGGRAVAMVAEVRGDATELVLPGLCAPGAWDLSIFCREVATGVTWAVQQGRVNVTPAPVLAGVAPARDELVAVLDRVTQELRVALGDSTASAAANARLAVAAREGAEAEAARAVDAAAKAEALKGVALDAAAKAALSAEGAEDFKRGAEAAAGDAAADAVVAEGKAAEAEASRVAAEAAQRQAEARAAEAEVGAKVATEAVSDALAARDEAVAAQRGAEAAQVVAVDASEQAGRYAAAAVGAADGAVVAQGEAEAAKVVAVEKAAEAEEKAALLGDAALRGGDNDFSGNNSHSGTEVFNGAVALNGAVDAVGAAVSLPVDVLRGLGSPQMVFGAEVTDARMWALVNSGSFDGEVLVLNAPKLAGLSYSSTGLLGNVLKDPLSRYYGKGLDKIGVDTARVLVCVAPSVLCGPAKWSRLEEAYFFVTENDYGDKSLQEAGFHRQALSSYDASFPRLRKLVVVAPHVVKGRCYSLTLGAVLDEFVFIAPKLSVQYHKTSGVWVRHLGNLRGCYRAAIYLPAMVEDFEMRMTKMDAVSAAFLLTNLPEVVGKRVVLGVGAGVVSVGADGAVVYGSEALAEAVAGCVGRGWSVELVDNSNLVY